MILLILISGVYFYIAGIAACILYEKGDSFWRIILCGAISILWLPILTASVLIGAWKLITAKLKTLSNDNKHKLSNERNSV